MNTRKKLVAVVGDLSVLHLGEAATSEIVGDWQIWQPEGSDVHYLVCRPPTRSDGYGWRAAQQFLTSLGVTVLPFHKDPVTQVQKLLPPQAKAQVKTLPAGIAATDTGWAAHQKLFDEIGWPPFDPMLD